MSPGVSLWGGDLYSGAWPLQRATGQLCRRQPRTAALVFPLAVINEFLLMDFWLAFPKQLS